MGADEKLQKAKRWAEIGNAIAEKARDAADALVDVEREDGEGRVDRVTLFGFITVYDRARRARRLARKRDRQAARDSRDAP